jgi:hypothetical protein
MDLDKNIINFITFYTGGKKYYDAGKRLMIQAESVGLFDNIYSYTQRNLKNDPDFWDKHSKFIQENPRGYGYWLWKPYIIKKQIENMKDDDILLYADCGCEIDIRKKKKIANVFEKVKDELIIANTTRVEKNWNKMDLIIKMGMRYKMHLNSPQHEAGQILFLVCNKTRDFVNEWYKLACVYHNIDDSPSINENVPSFKQHRHDQSIFSLLMKKNSINSKIYLKEYINYNRNKSGKSKINNNTIENEEETVICY